MKPGARLQNCGQLLQLLVSNLQLLLLRLHMLHHLHHSWIGQLTCLLQRPSNPLTTPRPCKLHELTFSQALCLTSW